MYYWLCDICLIWRDVRYSLQSFRHFSLPLLKTYWCCLLISMVNALTKQLWLLLNNQTVMKSSKIFFSVYSTINTNKYVIRNNYTVTYIIFQLLLLLFLPRVVWWVQINIIFLCKTTKLINIIIFQKFQCFVTYNLLLAFPFKFL